MTKLLIKHSIKNLMRINISYFEKQWTVRIQMYAIVIKILHYNHNHKQFQKKISNEKGLKDRDINCHLIFIVEKTTLNSIN